MRRRCPPSVCATTAQFFDWQAVVLNLIPSPIAFPAGEDQAALTHTRTLMSTGMGARTEVVDRGQVERRLLVTWWRIEDGEPTTPVTVSVD